MLHSASAQKRGFAGDRTFQVTDRNGKYCTPRDEDKVKLFHVRCRLDGDSLHLDVPNKQLNKQRVAPLWVQLSAPTTPAVVEVLAAPKPITLRDYGDKAAAWLEAATGIEGCRLTGIGDGYERKVEVNESQGDAIVWPPQAQSLCCSAHPSRPTT